MWRTTGYTSCTPCSSLPFLVLEFMRVSIIVHLILYISILHISCTVVNYINLPCSSTLVHCTFGFCSRYKLCVSLPRHLLPCTICIFTQTRTYILTLYIEVCVTLVYACLTACTTVQESIGGYM